MYQARPHQSLSTHEQECARTMSTLLAPLGLSQFGALIGGMHDFGKMSADFQQYMDALSQHISPPIPKGGIDHSTAGAQFVWNYFPIPEDSEEFLSSGKSLLYVLPPITTLLSLTASVARCPEMTYSPSAWKNPARKPILMKSCPN